MDSWVQTGKKSILSETLFLDQLHNFSLVSLNLFLHSFLKSEFLKKIFVTKIMSFLKVDSHKSRKTLLIIFTLGLEKVKNLFLNSVIDQKIDQIHVFLAFFFVFLTKKSEIPM